MIKHTGHTIKNYKVPEPLQDSDEDKLSQRYREVPHECDDPVWADQIEGRG